ncbi:VWA domain-containing protein [Paenisporosarcina sp. OV554]|uniref:vWA domain-containing protein n=1 Tax=Paenisporosarcina sp. OV554 TaxID=2135694 RepID=UPI000D351C90|nr:VWA domain-containing protein [Paenisporosarcina sp. OV554]PUB16772.1 Ca-activated chloride channel family protein [Paenisporosarcina sp. OV554]
MSKKQLILTGLLIMALTGCNEETKKTGIVPGEEISNKNETSGKSEPSNDSEPEKDSETNNKMIVEPLPENLNELAALTPGYTGYLAVIEVNNQKKIDELTKDLPDISSKPSNEELDHYYNAILSVFQQDYEGPEDLMQELKFQSIGSPDIDDPRMQFKENLNVMVILDASGSMGKDMNGQTQMEAAKSAITNFVKGLPENTNVGLRIYGQEGSGSKADKELSCKSSELIYPIGNYEANGFEQALAKAIPAGWTPIQLALNEAQKDLTSFKGDKNTNIVYLVSDGISTCDDNPVTAAKTLYESDITPIMNVIGFNVDSEGQKQLRAVAEATKGSYQDVQDAQGLQNELDQAKKVAEKWGFWKTSTEGNVGYERTNNDLDIFGYHSKEFKKWVDERQQVGFTLTYLLQEHEMMSQESHDYLQQKNKDYHTWVEQEYDKLRDELKVLNEMNYKEAMKLLEDTYKQNSTP